MTPIDVVPFLVSLGADILAVFFIAYLFYYRRYRNRQMMVAIAMINFCMFALSGALTSFTLSIGAGFALFAVISIIRLRSETAGWMEMTYLLVSLSIGLVLGLPGFSLFEEIVYAALLIIALFVLDFPGFLGSRNEQKLSLTLDTTDLGGDLKANVEEILGRKVLAVTVKSVTVNPPTTKVDVRFRD